MPQNVSRVKKRTILACMIVIYNEALKSSNVSQLIKQHMPTAWKEANVTPVFKNGNEAGVENYRPISLLCIFL